jgi:hypothetical protein
MTRITFLGAVAALLFLACSQTSVGIPCGNRDDCEPGQECRTAPGGFCSRGCTEPGSTRECPVGTLCTEFGGNQLVCSPRCTVDADCRLNFSCLLTSPTGTESACRPTGP